jgi:hypothetical protein
MTTKRQPITFSPTPSTDAAHRKAVKADPAAQGETEMLSARVSALKARQFRALAKLNGEKVQTLLDRAIGEFIERNRV